MFGCKPNVGLKSVLLSFDGLTKILSEDDLEAMLKTGESGEGQNVIVNRVNDAVNEDIDNLDKNSAAVNDSITVTIKPEPRSKLEQQSADIQLENQQPTVDIIKSLLSEH
ncbi:hypothetical protein WA026_022609 [Henosepilachna vigintioctopunctata]|uniref:Uncharacterized protein n=1 Tax=Henosepilachna vigintioctopunctata TaxID=420089 RepID=A0AAW1V597_9CUCU